LEVTPINLKDNIEMDFEEVIFLICGPHLVSSECGPVMYCTELTDCAQHSLQVCVTAGCLYVSYVTATLIENENG
jgi:hypothetical protein